MSIYSTINLSRARAQSEIMNRVLSASDEDLAEMLFALTRGSCDPLYYNNFRVGDLRGEDDEEAE